MGQLIFSWADRVIQENPQWFFRDAYKGSYNRWTYTIESSFGFSSYLLAYQYGVNPPYVDMQQCVSQRCQGLVYVTEQDNSYRYTYKQKDFYTYDDFWLQSLRYFRFNFQLAEDKMIFDLEFSDWLTQPLQCLPEHESLHRTKT